MAKEPLNTVITEHDFDSEHFHDHEDGAVAFSAAHLGEEDMFEDTGPKQDPFLRVPQRVAVRKGAVDKKTAVRLRTGMIFAVVLIVVGGTGFAVWRYATTSWRFRVESSDSIRMDGLQNVSRAQVLEVLGEDVGRNVFKVPLEERKRQLEEIAWVESASVMRLLPARLEISIKERVPVAFARVGARPMLIDASGVLMEMPAHRDGVPAREESAAYSFPVITGMDAAEPLSTRAPRMKIYASLMRDLESGETGYTKRVSEVELSDPDDVKVTVDGSAGPVIVHLGSGNFQDRFRMYVTHESEWRTQFTKLDSVDLRYNGQIIINPENKTPLKTAVPANATESKAPKQIKQ